MARVILQKGHVDRETGATGTEGEQQLASSVVDLAAAKLRAHGHHTVVVLADQAYPHPADVFVAQHADGSDNRAAGGMSVGYPDLPGGRLAHQIKVAYQRRGWSGRIRADNYTGGLRGYYGYRRHPHVDARVVFEAGFMTNPSERAWLDGHHGTVAQAICDAVGVVYGHPIGDTPPPAREGDMLKRGDRGAEVVVMQWWINEFLHGDATHPAGIKADGDFGSASEAYVREVQHRFGYATSGVWDLSVAQRVREVLDGRRFDALRDGLADLRADLAASTTSP